MALPGRGCVSTASSDGLVGGTEQATYTRAVVRLTMLIRILAVAGASLILVSVGWARSSFSGTWVARSLTLKGIPICSGGRDIGCMPRSVQALYTFRLTFRGSGLQYYGEGPTDASHDPVSAKGTCRMRLARDHVAAGWMYYAAVAKATFSGEGGPGVPCQELPISGYDVSLRIRLVGVKLRVEFGYSSFPAKYKAYTFVSRVS